MNKLRNQQRQTLVKIVGSENTRSKNERDTATVSSVPKRHQAHGNTTRRHDHNEPDHSDHYLTRSQKTPQGSRFSQRRVKRIRVFLDFSFLKREERAPIYTVEKIGEKGKPLKLSLNHYLGLGKLPWKPVTRRKEYRGEYQRERGRREADGARYTKWVRATY